MERKHIRALRRVKPDLIRIARSVAERGFSYRGFKVGCAIFAWRPPGVGLTERYRVFKAANAKPFEGGRKFCAEMTTCCYARSNGYSVIIAVAIAGLPQRDGGSLVESETLHPCEDCRPFLAALPETRPDTRIITIHNHKGLVKEFSLKQILKIHGDKAPWGY